MTSLFGLANLEFPKGKWEFVENWFLMGSPIPLLTIWASYLLFVLKVGPAIMKNRKPFQLKKTLLVYNAFQVVYSMYIVIESIRFFRVNGVVHTKCQFTQEENRNEILRLSWYYLMGKMSELLDTVFFVLRKKHNQVTFLHVYHHSLMFILSWMFIKYFGTDSATFIGSINSFVHVIMYGYYGLAALGPQVAKYLTWKKHITALQLTQFVLIFLHFGISDYLSDCPASKVYIYILVPNVTLFLYLFSRFYVKTYNEKENNKKQKVSLESDNNAHAKGQNGFAKEVRRQRSTTKDFKGM